MSFNVILKEAIYSQNMTDPIGFSTKDNIYKCPLFSYAFMNLFITFSGHFIFSILLQHHISKLSKYFRSNFLSVQVSEQYKAMLQT